MARELNEHGVEAALVAPDRDFVPVSGGVYVCRGKLSKGFEYSGIKYAVFSLNEIIGEQGLKKKRKKIKKGKAIESFTDLKVGDYVVHESHGIGVYRGLEKITVDGINKDYLLSLIHICIKEQGWRINELRQLNMNVENINCFILALQVKNSDISDETAVKELNNIDGVYYIEEV